VCSGNGGTLPERRILVSPLVTGLVFMLMLGTYPALGG
jgi:ABC-type sulfate transport system permease subunit